MYLCTDTKVTLARNYLSAFLSSRSIRKVKEIAHNPDKPVLTLSRFIMVEFG